MFCVQKFTFDMLPVFTEDMIIKHSLMKSVLWGNSFSVICVNLRISLGNQFWSIFSREGSFLCASCTILPPWAPVWQGTCFLSIWRMQVPYSLQIPVALFPFWWSHSSSFYESGQNSFLGCHCPGCQMRGVENAFRGLSVLSASRANGFHTGLPARGCKTGSVSHTQSSDMFGLAHSLHGILPTFFKSANFSKKFRVDISEGWQPLTQTAIIRVVLT